MALLFWFACSKIFADHHEDSGTAVPLARGDRWHDRESLMRQQSWRRR
jgi:hypothetical protein